MDLHEYGVPGIIAMGAIGAIAYLAKFIKDMIADHKAEREELEKIHRAEREDWKKTIERQFDDANRQAVKNTDALTELSTIVKTLRK